MMVVFPFEVDFYSRYGIEAHFVGHPLVEVVEEETLQKSLTADSMHLGLMPGSRKSEIGFNLESQVRAANQLRESFNIKTSILVAPTLELQAIQDRVSKIGGEFEFIQTHPTQMIQACDWILTASGTATLQVALCEKPMVVMYRMNPWTAKLARWLVKDVDSFCIVNLVAGKKIVPELFQEEAEAGQLASAMGKIIGDKDYQEQMLKELRQVKNLLGEGRATLNLIEKIEGFYPN